VKVKVGVGDDAGRVAAVRAAMGPAAALRLDANGAWEVEEAIAAIAALGPAGLELVEEPVHGVHALRQVRRSVAVRIAMDETAAEPGALASAAADAVCLKLSRAGGISGLLAAATLVRTTEAEAYVASTLDGPIGIAAAVHAAAALAPLPACGLATLGLFAGVDPGRSPSAAAPSRCRRARDWGWVRERAAAVGARRAPAARAACCAGSSASSARRATRPRACARTSPSGSGRRCSRWSPPTASRAAGRTGTRAASRPRSCPGSASSAPARS
jgi:hypothetical protein